MDIGLLVTFAGIFVAALAGVLGVWMERDRENPPYWAIFFSSLIVFAGGIEATNAIVHGWFDSATEDAMAEVLEELAELADNSDDPELAGFVGDELGRANPKMMRRVEKKMVAKGGDPDRVRKRAAEGRRRKGAKAGGDGEGKAGKGGKAGGEDGAPTDAPAGGAPADGAPADGAPADGAPADGAPAGEGKTGKGGKADGEGKAGKGKAG